MRLRYREHIARELFDNLTRLLREDPVVALREFRGEFAIGGRSALLRQIMESGEYESALARICASHATPDRDAIDVGANIGFYTVLMAKCLTERRVLAIEPTPGALQRLHRNLRINGVQDRAIVYEGAVGDRQDSVTINTIAGREEFSSLGEMVHPSIAGARTERIEVPCRTIDDLTAELGLDPGFIKIDVEGMEHVVLAGMHQVLERRRPVILSELSDPLLKRNGSSAAAVIDMLRRFDYRVLDPLYPRLPAGRRPFGDILCVPNKPRTPS
jgi:FkbM family methyltransferase